MVSSTIFEEVIPAVTGDFHHVLPRGTCAARASPRTGLRPPADRRGLSCRIESCARWPPQPCATLANGNKTSVRHRQCLRPGDSNYRQPALTQRRGDGGDGIVEDVHAQKTLPPARTACGLVAVQLGTGFFVALALQKMQQFGIGRVGSRPASSSRRVNSGSRLGLGIAVAIPFTDVSSSINVWRICSSISFMVAQSDSQIPPDNQVVSHTARLTLLRPATICAR